MTLTADGLTPVPKPLRPLPGQERGSGEYTAGELAFDAILEGPLLGVVIGVAVGVALLVRRLARRR